jgi:phosphate acyltransferase
LTRLTIALDAMGGDFGPSVVVPAAALCIKNNSSLELILVGNEKILREYLQKSAVADHPRLKIQHASEVVAMDESPALALRNKKDSSMRVAIDLVKEKRAHACVSAGNTGALMATARFVLKTISGIDRPAIITSFPTTQPNRIVRMLDLGANVDCTPEHLLQFAVMGSIVASAVSGIHSPKLAVLNIGTEAIKGNEQVKQASELISKHPQLNFVGNVEGDHIFKGDVDVIVCDGFIGNIALKSSEGAVQLIFYYLRYFFEYNGLTKIMAFLCKPIFKRLKKEIDPTNFNGASLVGLKGIVVKSHGSANIPAFVNAIEEAVMLISQNVPEKIEAHVSEFLT